VESSVLRDWESSFQPKIVAKRQPNPPEMGKALPSDHTAVGERLAEFVSFLRFDRKIRTVICTTNAIESISAQVRRAVTERSGLRCL
jgi:transposase-like protein